MSRPIDQVQKTFLALRILAAAVAIALSVGPPLALWQIERGRIVAELKIKNGIAANNLSNLIVRDPSLWRFEVIRIEEIIGGFLNSREGAVLLDTDGRSVAAMGQHAAGPSLTVKTLIYDSGIPVGTLIFSRKLDHVLLNVVLLLAICTPAGGACYFLFVRGPVSALMHTTHALYVEQERAKTTLSSIGDAVVAVDNSARIQYMNPAAESLAGISEAASLGSSVADILRFVNERTGKPISNPLGQAISRRKTVVSGDHVALHGVRGDISVESTAAPIVDGYGEVVGGVIVLHDVDSSRRMADQLEWQATHDPLTGLPNRILFGQKLQQAVDDAKNGADMALCIIDLDQFKIINDTCGHSAGDELLKQITIVLEQRIRRSDTFARLGGDEFGLLLSACDIGRARAVADQLVKAVRAFRFIHDGRTFSIGASIGVVPITATAEVSQVMSAADAACYTAKERGRGRVQVYQLHDRELAARHEEMDWATRIAKALDEQRLVLFAQPYRPLTSAAEEGHSEILVRMIQADGSLVPPGAFIPAAERYNLMARMDRHIVELAFNAYVELQSAGKWAINLSGASLSDPKLSDFVEDSLRRHDLDPTNFCFEITETSAIGNLGSGLKTIQKLRSFGCGLALDDFGQGFSSFSYLANLPVDYLKIDGEYVRDMVYNPVHKVIVRALNEIGHSYGLRTIAEYAEDQETVAHLQEIGVDYAQGYAVGHPLPLRTNHCLGYSACRPGGATALPLFRRPPPSSRPPALPAHDA